MPEYLSPGVYVEEIATGPRPIEGVGTSTAGFVGPAERGPEPPQLIASWLEYQRRYGGHDPNRSYLSYAIQGFFDNGGVRCFVSRVVGTGAQVATLVIGELTIWAIGRGAWGNLVEISIEPAKNKAADQFRVLIGYKRDPNANPADNVFEIIEDFDNLSATVGASNNAEIVINSGSNLVRVAWSNNPARPADAGYAPMAGGNDGAQPLVPADYIGTYNAIIQTPQFPETEPLGRSNGLRAIEMVDEVAILVVPDEVRNGLETLSDNVINQCESLKDRFGVVSGVQGQSNVTNVGVTNDTSYAAYYYPWIRIYDAAFNTTRLVPPSGHIAGIMARTDITRGVHKAPANEVVRSARNLEFPVTAAMQDILNPQGINCIRDFRSDGRGIRLWGARTMSSDGMWKYVNVRRLFIFVEESIIEGTQWVVFEPNDYGTWGDVTRTITSFLNGVWRSGALLGRTQQEAFFVRCDRTTMTQDDIDNGRLICYIGIAPVKPAEFVIFRISQKTAEADA
ncbi:MAG: phage tail protein [Anaerolineaceae bacterium]|nr:phage tail protein [Anaerolineaceae bacterium]